MTREGSGKTLLTTRFALNNCKEFSKKRFFYITAFLSVLEQNAKEIKDIIDDDLVLEHHSNIVFSDYEKEESGNNKKYYSQQYMMDSWESPVILTTMVQFMNTLFKGRSSNIRRFCKLIDSVIVLDEVQSIPISTISNFNLVNNFLAEIMNATIIHCTATQPELDSSYLEFSSDYSNTNKGYLARLEEEQVEVFNRAKAFYISKENGFNIEEISDHIKEEVEYNNSILVICNTKKSVNEIYENIKELEYGDFSIYQLTTNQCAAHRLRKIEEIKEKLTNDEKIIVVSTQLIEAGVDVDFKLVYRSLSGIPSLIQAMGRCNREGKLDYGRFYIFDLTSENTKMIQDIHQQKKQSRRILEEFKNKEVDINLLKKEYYNYLYSNSEKLDYPTLEGSLLEILSTNEVKRKEYRQSTSKKYEYFLGQNFKLAADSFHMIEDNGYTVIVSLQEGFGELYNKNQKYLNEYKEAIEEYDFHNAKIALKKLQPFTININDIDKYELYIEKIGDILVLMPNYYDEDIGLNVKTLETLIY